METAVQLMHNRYRQEADNNSCLSCGNNIIYADLQAGEKLLDLGSGRGEDVFYAAKVVGPEGFALGIDLTPEMIAKARVKKQELGVKNADFLQGSIEALPVEDAGFDVVISNCVINHVPDKVKVYREIFRILKPGGRFIISDVITEEALPREVKNDPKAWADCWGGAITEAEYLQAIDKAGFEQVTFLTRRAYHKNGYAMSSVTIKGEKHT